MGGGCERAICQPSYVRTYYNHRARSSKQTNTRETARQDEESHLIISALLCCVVLLVALGQEIVGFAADEDRDERRMLSCERSIDLNGLSEKVCA